MCRACVWLKIRFWLFQHDFYSLLFIFMTFMSSELPAKTVLFKLGLANKKDRLELLAPINLQRHIKRFIVRAFTIFYLIGFFFSFFFPLTNLHQAAVFQEIKHKWHQMVVNVPLSPRMVLSHLLWLFWTFLAGPDFLIFLIWTKVNVVKSHLEHSPDQTLNLFWEKQLVLVGSHSPRVCFVLGVKIFKGLLKPWNELAMSFCKEGGKRKHFGRDWWYGRLPYFV